MQHLNPQIHFQNENNQTRINQPTRIIAKKMENTDRAFGTKLDNNTLQNRTSTTKKKLTTQIQEVEEVEHMSKGPKYSKETSELKKIKNTTNNILKQKSLPRSALVNPPLKKKSVVHKQYIDLDFDMMPSKSLKDVTFDEFNLDIPQFTSEVDLDINYL
eukprot:TRINITY_DN2172_c0_g3_i1.p1 TRINITY_DN2172_c0_g3~~TRINITY_DN2172_c0_g3_i1.p1  ORF type:complete len:159 (-),score=50.42 TRINITY_DN2172_c0_g3_i1:73-549(-)